MQRPPRGQAWRRYGDAREGCLLCHACRSPKCCHGSGYFARGMRRGLHLPDPSEVGKVSLASAGSAQYGIAAGFRTSRRSDINVKYLVSSGSDIGKFPNVRASLFPTTASPPHTLKTAFLLPYATVSRQQSVPLCTPLNRSVLQVVYRPHSPPYNAARHASLVRRARPSSGL